MSEQVPDIEGSVSLQTRVGRVALSQNISSLETYFLPISRRSTQDLVNQVVD